MKKKKSKNPVPYPYSKFITPDGWKKLRKEDRKIITDLVKFQNKMWKKYPNGFGSDEEYINMNAEIEYLKSIGEH
jgi:hypothetical protein